MFFLKSFSSYIWPDKILDRFRFCSSFDKLMVWKEVPCQMWKVKESNICLCNQKTSWHN